MRHVYLELILVALLFGAIAVYFTACTTYQSNIGPYHTVGTK